MSGLSYLIGVGRSPHWRRGTGRPRPPVRDPRFRRNIGSGSRPGRGPALPPGGSAPEYSPAGCCASAPTGRCTASGRSWGKSCGPPDPAPFLEMVAILSQTGAACKPETVGGGVFLVHLPGYRSRIESIEKYVYNFEQDSSCENGDSKFERRVQNGTPVGPAY